MTNELCKRKSLSRIVRSAITAIGVSTWIWGAPALAAISADQAKRIHERLTGNMPSDAILLQMMNSADGLAAARIAIDNDEDHSFYNVTLKNWAAPWTNREFDAFADLNDYIATAIGFVRDADGANGVEPRDFRGLLYEDVLYIGNDPDVGNDPELPLYAVDNNDHYVALEAGLELNGDPGYSLKRDLVPRTQSSLVDALAPDGASGVITSRAGAKAFLIAGTNRAAFRFTMLNHLCLDMEQVHDVTRIPDRIRQDVSRSPGGDSRIFLNNCIGCHNGMDPMTQALAYHNFEYDPAGDPTGERGEIEYRGNLPENKVHPKYFNNAATFPYGFVTPNNSWANYWREGQNAVLGWDPNLPGEGEGASSMFRELAHTDAFAQCHVKRVFKTVCLREPHNPSDLEYIRNSVTAFKIDGNMKDVFASSASHCMGN